jgi:hypothetical protein
VTRNQRGVLNRVRESSVLRAVLEYLRYHPRVAKAWRQNSGAVTIEGRHVRFTDEVGIPDICGFLKDGRGLYIECKAPGGRLTYWQTRFLEAAEKAGCVCGVVRSVDEVEALIKAATVWQG